jgi:hypothetical protein
MRILRRLAGSLSVVFLVAACAGSASPTAPPPDRTAGAPPVAVPSGSPPAAASPSIGPDSPVTDDPNAPIGTDVPPGTSDPGQGPFVIAKPGQLDVHPVRLDGLAAAVDGRHVVVTATWTSGVEPCYVLDHIFVETGARSFTITVFEGHGPGDNICIEIAQIKQTQIDLGELAPGTYAIADSQGGAAPIEVTVN